MMRRVDTGASPGLTPAAAVCRRLGVIAMLTALPAAHAATLDTRLLVAGLSEPLFATAPLADGRLFVVEKGGTIKVTQGGVTSDFLTLPVESGGEQGLLGLAFDPHYGDAGTAGHRRFFVNFIDPVTRDTVIASYRATSDPLRADPASRVEVMRIDQPADSSNHKAGWIGFKPGDASHLYIATGDGGGAPADPTNQAQNRNGLLGKILRVDIGRDDFAADPLRNYGIPTDNPYAATPGARGEIYATGLRNPFRNGFDRATGDLWIADVGQGTREEIDVIRAGSGGGQNFGWRIREGDVPTPGVDDPPVAGLTDPVLSYDHSFGAAITGGVVVRQAGSPLDGQYVFGDFVSGRVWSIAADGSDRTLADASEWTSVLNAGAAGALGNIASFGEGADGSLYVVDYGGKVVQLFGVTAAVPEPASALMLLAGGAWLLGRRRQSAPR